MLDHLVCTSEIVVDRPKNSKHPKYSECIYPVDYGYLKNTASADGDGIDVWMGSDVRKLVDSVVCIVDIVKQDSEIKILVGCTEEEKERILLFHNSTKGMKDIMIRRDC